MADFLHPETGLPLSTHEEFMAALAEIEERMAPLYRVRRLVREAAAEAYPPPRMPAPRSRTATQEKVARCPRCGGRLDENGEGAAPK